MVLALLSIDEAVEAATVTATMATAMTTTIIGIESIVEPEKLGRSICEQKSKRKKMFEKTNQKSFFFFKMNNKTPLSGVRRPQNYRISGNYNNRHNFFTLWRFLELPVKNR